VRSHLRLHVTNTADIVRSLGLLSVCQTLLLLLLLLLLHVLSPGHQQGSDPGHGRHHAGKQGGEVHLLLLLLLLA
jgi:hypothetical protein